MNKTDSIYIRLEPQVKNEANNVLSQIGLSISDAVTVFLKQVALTGSIPFMLKVPEPNKETLEAVKESRKLNKTGKGFTDISELRKSLES